MAAVIKNLHVIAGHRHCGGTDFDRERLNAHRVARNGVTGLGLPPVVDHRQASHVAQPFDRVGVCALTCQEDRFQMGQVVIGKQLTFWVLAFYGTERGWGGKEYFDVVL